jgi:tripartite ATP-independent transporter DctM subunit
MDWTQILALIFASLLLLMFTGMPIAFAFMLINLVGAFFLFQGALGPIQIVRSIYSSVASFILLPIPLFVFMGDLMFYSGIGTKAINVVDKWLGRMPGRLGLVTVGTGTILGALTGVTVASVSIMGSTLVPEMEKRGYKKSMSLGPVLGSGGLAIMIPPSSLAVFLAAIAEVSVGKVLMAIIVPGLLMAVLFAAYIIIRCYLQPSIAPPYEIPSEPLGRKLLETVKDTLPLAFIIFMVIGVIFAGIATPSEAAATGTVGTLLVALLYKRVNWPMIKTAVKGTLKVSGMLFMILASAQAFSQIMAFTGATRGLAEWAVSLPISPMAIIVGMQIIVLILGCFIDAGSITMITIPIFMPIILALGFDPIWFCAVMLLNLELAMITPPFGLSLFVMKGVAPRDTTMGDIIRAALPFIGLDLIAMAIIMAFPAFTSWLPGLMK